MANQVLKNARCEKVIRIEASGVITRRILDQLFEQIKANAASGSAGGLTELDVYLNLRAFES